jgi:hypothetical protein
VPNAFWLAWLGAVLEVPAEELAAAAARTASPATSSDRTATEPLRPAPGPPRGRSVLATRVGELRRMDDLVGGVDLADLVDRELRAGLDLLRASRSGVQRRRLLALVAELAQLAGWTAADAGRGRAALRAYRVALSAAGEIGDRALGGHVLGCVSHLLAATGNPGDALLLARAAHAGMHRAGPAGVQILLLHRIAFAAALAGERRASEQALAAAERLADSRDPHHEPPWLYWLDDGELAALAGRCFAALGRPLRAEPLLRNRMTARTGPRTMALDGCWLAEAYLAAGEAEQACAIAGSALLAAVRSGSSRAAARALAQHDRLIGSGAAAPARAYAALVAAVQGYLPGVARVRRRASG